MNEESYHAKVEKLFLDLESILESANPEVDWDINEGLLTIIFPKGSQLILSRQSSLQELWLASPTGAFHFQNTAEGWTTRQGETLTAVLKQLFEQFHIQVNL